MSCTTHEFAFILLFLNNHAAGEINGDGMMFYVNGDQYLGERMIFIPIDE